MSEILDEKAIEANFKFLYVDRLMILGYNGQIIADDLKKMLKSGVESFDLGPYIIEANSKYAQITSNVEVTITGFERGSKQHANRVFLNGAINVDLQLPDGSLSQVSIPVKNQWPVNVDHAATLARGNVVYAYGQTDEGLKQRMFYESGSIDDNGRSIILNYPANFKLFEQNFDNTQFVDVSPKQLEYMKSGMMDGLAFPSQIVNKATGEIMEGLAMASRRNGVALQDAKGNFLNLERAEAVAKKPVAKQEAPTGNLNQEAEKKEEQKLPPAAQKVLEAEEQVKEQGRKVGRKQS